MTPTAAPVENFVSEVTGALGQFGTGNLATILVAALGITAVLAIAWFAYRFITRKVAGAMKNGRI